MVMERLTVDTLDLKVGDETQLGRTKLLWKGPPFHDDQGVMWVPLKWQDNAKPLNTRSTTRWDIYRPELTRVCSNLAGTSHWIEGKNGGVAVSLTAAGEWVTIAVHSSVTGERITRAVYTRDFKELLRQAGILDE